jgi:hypothetical protein
VTLVAVILVLLAATGAFVVPPLLEREDAPGDRPRR